MTELLHIQRQLDDLAFKLDVLLKSKDAEQLAQWVDRKTACQLLNISDSHLMKLVAKGTIKSNAIKNVGTVRKLSLIHI